tara:strand:+ start:730 stop:1113 length:384 start_codon:yes stop_codon:yes gene_type:complete
MINKKKKNRSFGILFFIVFFIIGLYPVYVGNSVNIYLILLSILFLVLGILNSKILTPLNIAWLKLGELLGVFISPIIMALIYFLILTPISLIVRIFGKDLLNIKFNSSSKTYWIKRKKNVTTMKKQF